MKIEFKGTALEYAQSHTAPELKRTIRDIKKGVYDEFSDRCRICFEKYLDGDMESAGWWSNHAELAR